MVIRDTRQSVHDHSAFHGSELADIDGAFCLTGRQRHVQKVAAIGQEVRIQVVLFVACLIQCRRGGWHSSTRRHTRETAPGVGNEHDDAVFVPGAAKAIPRIAQRLRRPSGNPHALELSVGKEANRQAIRRPERRLCTICSRQWPRSISIERSDPEHRIAIALSGHKGKVESIRRDDRYVLTT